MLLYKVALGGGAGPAFDSSDVFCLCSFALVFTMFLAVAFVLFWLHVCFPLVFTVFSGLMTLLMLR